MEGVEAWEKLKRRGEIIADVRGKRGMMMTGVVLRGGGICNLRYSRLVCIRFVSCTARSPRYQAY